VARYHAFRPSFIKSDRKMITKQTVFILGAGASTPYGYPAGDSLKK